MPAADRFVPLAEWLAGPVPAPAPALEPAPEPQPSAPVPAPAPAAPIPPEVELLRDLRLFRARLADALSAASASLARELAYAVLGRELQTAPADLTALATRILAEHPAAEPVAIRHAPGETVDIGLPAIVDPALDPGDLIVVFTAGEVDARLGVRLAVVLEAWS